MADTSTIYAVSGASGKLGREVLELLLDEEHVPAARIVAITRDPSKLAAFAARGVQVRVGDFEKPETLSAAFKGVGRLLLISTDAVDRPGRRIAQHRNAIDAAKAAGVRHVVYTSMVAPDEGSPVPFAVDHRLTEEALAASGLEYTSLRMMWYMEGLVGKAGQALTTGKWVTTAAEEKSANIAHMDCARASAAALLSSEGGRRVLDMTGGEAHSVSEIAAALTRLTGKPIEVVHVTPEEYEAGLKAAGLPPFVVPIVWSIDVNTRLGRAGKVSNDFEKLTGRKATALNDWLSANRTAFTG
jgi:NAD(P)H dehydrogenase (quinone)